MKPRLVLDTSFVLPFLGVNVRGIDPGIVEEYASQGYELLYPLLALPELLGVITRAAEKRGLGKLPREALEGIEALIRGEDVKLVEPRFEHIATALELRLRGHRDIFDCIFYSTALHEGAALLTADETLLKFIKAEGYDASIILLVRTRR
ncbi:PilT protein domain protein [Pyrolobus fumarii 1A]|uniref:PilT protein domain protein n=1 Tax=Pyrolobus fumarii (strain DSM 11204 / 1A) TaxID=694429 RepID=G0ECY9_PYRF1|nr:PIN domain-containing protein [Pyrolobus fumarii]AEM39709.1 PilT protein domain protein [Pyrolobus fumarii 1A]